MLGEFIHQHYTINIPYHLISHYKQVSLDYLYKVQVTILLGYIVFDLYIIKIIGKKRSIFITTFSLILNKILIKDSQIEIVIMLKRVAQILFKFRNTFIQSSKFTNA